MRKIYKRPKLIHGHGVNDADYYVSPRNSGGRIKCPFYETWKNMISRAYSPKFHVKFPTYFGVTVCDQWLTFSNFKEWMKTQDWQRNEIDKDIIKPGNKHYSPETCCFVSHALNNLLTVSAVARGVYPIGVCYDKQHKKFRAQCSFQKDKSRYLGLFDTPSTTHSAYIKFKTGFISNLAAKQTDPRIANGLMRHAALIAIGG